MQKVKLENWAVVALGSPYTAPEARVQALRGEVYGHPDFSDGDKITTSRVVDIGEGIAKTKNTKYNLGTPEGDYVAWCIKNGYNIWKGPK